MSKRHTITRAALARHADALAAYGAARRRADGTLPIEQFDAGIYAGDGFSGRLQDRYAVRRPGRETVYQPTALLTDEDLAAAVTRLRNLAGVPDRPALWSVRRGAATPQSKEHTE